jgi:hypothetical protein
MVDLKTLLGLDGEAVTDENNAVCYELYDSTADSACTLPFMGFSRTLKQPLITVAVDCRRIAR